MGLCKFEVVLEEAKAVASRNGKQPPEMYPIRLPPASPLKAAKGLQKPDKCHIMNLNSFRQKNGIVPG